MKDWTTRILQRVLLRVQRGMVGGMQEGMREMLDEMVKGVLDPEKLAEMMKKMGIDVFQLSGTMSQGKVQGFDAYRVLGLDRSASDDEVKKRYRELLHKLHPDTAGTPGTESLFQMVIAAFEMIKIERGWQS